MRPLGLILIAAALYAQTNPVKTEDVHRIFAAFNNQTPGCAVGVAQAGKVVFRAGYGMADLERRVPITPETVFESGSVAKQFTAASLMLLAQDGKLSLDDPLSKLLPELKNYSTPFTIRHVIHHTSGLREWRPLAYFNGEAEGTRVIRNEDILRYAALQRNLNFDPGSAYSYSNTGYNMSTILIERALGDGQSFPAYTQARIFGPLGMTHTQWRDDFRRVVPGRALAYGKRDGVYVSQTPIENIIGAGGLLTTVDDLLLWNENFTHAKVGGAEFVKAQQVPTTLSGGRQIAYAAGLQVTEQMGTREVGHSGATGGYRTWLARYPEKQLSVAVMCNAAEAVPTALGRETARLWIGALHAPKNTPADASSLAGLYRNVRNNTTMEVKPDGLGRDAAGKLRLNGAEVTPIDAPVKGFRLTDANDVSIYERVDSVQPSAARLKDYVGVYRSAEATEALHIQLSPSGGLSMQVGRLEPLEMKPTFSDAFSTANGALRFHRDAQGRVSGLSAGDGRVWDFRFTRQ
jgi:CubicO group peptidase (beta-lactamase class C family)